MPGLAAPQSEGGIGFDYRFAMGIPDYWIKLIKDYPDNNWPMGTLWFELNNRRQDEKTISYCESHDQALVGDQTLIFRLIGSAIYDHMHKHDTHHAVDRGMALHKIIRLITLATAGSGYLNFMGNEFGHPEWIDFPRQGNNWSYQYARRQWHLADDENLKYHQLARFDRDMIQMTKTHHLLDSAPARLLHEHNNDKVIAFLRARRIIVFNFHPSRSHNNYPLFVSPGEYRMVFNSDDSAYGGHDRLKTNQVHFTQPDESGVYYKNRLSLYLPTLTALVLVKKTIDDPGRR
jgi:1,4-alpha-glucan branching enzyme